MKKLGKTLVVFMLAGACVYGVYAYQNGGIRMVKDQLCTIKAYADTLIKKASRTKPLSSGSDSEAAYLDREVRCEVGDDVTDQVMKWISNIKESGSAVQARDSFDPSLSESEGDQIYEWLCREELSCLHAAYCGELEDTQIVSLEYVDSSGYHKDFVQFTVTDGADYRYGNREDLWNTISEQMLCSICGGSGQIMDGNGTACGICGGTGQQYIPNLYYDAIMGWTGGYVGCGGCGGSGYIGNVSFHTCNNCMGFGFRIK